MTTVLVVDDNATNRKLARDVLNAAGFRTVEAATGAEGIAQATEHEPDVILLDLRLPDIPGREVVEALRNGERTAGIPIVAMSAMPLAGACGSRRPASRAASTSRSTSARSSTRCVGTARQRAGGTGIHHPSSTPQDHAHGVGRRACFQ